jgi:hypothetical protein
LLDPDLDLLSAQEVKKITDKIERVSKKLNKDAAEAEALGIGLPSGDENSKSSLVLVENSLKKLIVLLDLSQVMSRGFSYFYGTQETNCTYKQYNSGQSGSPSWMRKN